MELNFLKDIRDNIINYINMETILFDNPNFKIDLVVEKIIKLSVEKKDSDFIKKVNQYLLDMIEFDELLFNNLYIYLFKHKTNLSILRNFINNNRIEWSKLHNFISKLHKLSIGNVDVNIHMDTLMNIHMDTIEFLIDIVYIFPNIFVDKYVEDFNGNYYFKINKIYKKISDVDINY